MASHLKIVFVTCLLLLILLEEFKPVLAKGKQQLKQRTKILETGVADLKAKIKSLEDCNACSKLKDLNDTINELRKKIDNKTKLADCGDPGFPVHGSKTGNDYKAGGTVNFACDTGYHLEGPTNLLCLKNGTWDNTIPKCHRLCKEPAPPKNGHKTGSEFWEGKTVTYKCDNGFKLQGPTARVCNSNGDWTGEEPTCEPEVASAAAGLEDSEILKGDPSHLKKIGDFLKPVVQSNTHWKRCWRASQDGWAAKTFHVQCDGESPTVTIVRVGKYIFGGFTSEYWWADGGCAYHEDSKAFLFTLVNAPGQPALKLEQRKILTENGKKAMFSCWIYGPTFGGEIWGDLYIADYAGWNKKSFTSLQWYGYGYAYRWSFLLGDSLLGHFTPDEVEVFYGTT